MNNDITVDKIREAYKELSGDVEPNIEWDIEKSRREKIILRCIDHYDENEKRSIDRVILDEIFKNSSA